LGLCIPIWLHLTAAEKKPALVAVPASESVARSLVASPAPVPAPAAVVPHAPALATAPPPASAPHADADALHVAATAKHPDSAVEIPVSSPKPDHLSLAREAFNARDWTRALDEGKRAVAAGGGAEAHAIVGNTNYKMGRFAEAEQEYTKAVALEPSNKLLRDRQSIAHARAEEIKKGKEP